MNLLQNRGVFAYKKRTMACVTTSQHCFWLLFHFKSYCQVRGMISSYHCDRKPIQINQFPDHTIILMVVHQNHSIVIESLYNVLAWHPTSTKYRKINQPCLENKRPKHHKVNSKLLNKITQPSLVMIRQRPR